MEVLIIKLDYSLESPEERNQLVKQILEETPDPNPRYLEALADYLVLPMEKQEKKQKKILTDNRMVTVGKRETSFEGLVSQFENGEDGIYGLITNDKNQIFRPAISITKKDLEEIPFLKQLREAIEIWEQKLKRTSGKDAYIIKKTIIDLRKDQYIIKEAYRRPFNPNKLTRSKSILPLNGEIHLEEDDTIAFSGVTLADYKVCRAILSNYGKLKEDNWGDFDSELWYLLHDFDRIAGVALESYPFYLRLVELKVDGLMNVDIQKQLLDEFGYTYTVEYLSSLWRNKIPKLIAEVAQLEYLNWYYFQVEKGKYKRCSRCGKVKLAHNKYFSKNKGAKDNLYSICKDCRNEKRRLTTEKAKQLGSIEVEYNG